MKYKVKYHEYEFKLKDSKAISTPEKLHKVLKDDYSPLSEEMYLLVLNIKNQVIDKYLIAKGGYNMVMCTPADILRQVLQAGGQNFIVAHNHPSNSVEPSQEDIIFTKKVEKASQIVGLNLLDHLIYTPEKFYSFKKNGII